MSLDSMLNASHHLEQAAKALTEREESLKDLLDDAKVGTVRWNHLQTRYEIATYLRGETDRLLASLRHHQKECP